MTDLLIPLSSLQACEPDLVGPKAATLAVLGRAGLPVPEGVCLTAHAYGLQMTALGFDEVFVDELTIVSRVREKKAARRVGKSGVRP